MNVGTDLFDVSNLVDSKGTEKSHKQSNAGAATTLGNYNFYGGSFEFDGIGECYKLPIMDLSF